MSGLVIVATIFTILHRFLIVNTGARGICQTNNKVLKKYDLINKKLVYILYYLKLLFLFIGKWTSRHQ